jgi:hypothetical protein
LLKIGFIKVQREHPCVFGFGLVAEYKKLYSATSGIKNIVVADYVFLTQPQLLKRAYKLFKIIKKIGATYHYITPFQ